jgi:hypothetical protein
LSPETAAAASATFREQGCVLLRGALQPSLIEDMHGSGQKYKHCQVAQSARGMMVDAAARQATFTPPSLSAPPA